MRQAQTLGQRVRMQREVDPISKERPELRAVTWTASVGDAFATKLDGRHSGKVGSPTTSFFWVAAIALSAASCSQPPSRNALHPVADGGNAPVTLDWKVVRPPGPELPTLAGVWARGDDVYASSAAPDRPATVVSSHDHGRSWAAVSLGQADTVLRGVAADASRRVVAVGFQLGDGFIPFVATSADGGKAFAALPVAWSGHPHAVWVDAALGVLIVGADAGGGFFARSADAGTTWTKVGVPNAADLNALWVSPQGEIYAAGAERLAADDGAIAGSPSNGGATDGGLSDASAATEALHGLQGLVVRSDDGGTTWSAVLSGTPPLGPGWTGPGPGTTPAVLFAISGTPDGARIVATGDLLTVAQSTDHGTTWVVDDGYPPSLTTPQRFAGDQITGVWVVDEMSPPYMAVGSSLGQSEGLLRGIGYPTGFVDDASGGLDTFFDSIEGHPAVYGVTGAGPGDGWAVGENGLIAHGVPR